MIPGAFPGTRAPPGRLASTGGSSRNNQLPWDSPGRQPQGPAQGPGNAPRDPHRDGGAPWGPARETDDPRCPHRDSQGPWGLSRDEGASRVGGGPRGPGRGAGSTRGALRDNCNPRGPSSQGRRPGGSSRNLELPWDSQENSGSRDPPGTEQLLGTLTGISAASMGSPRALVTLGSPTGTAMIPGAFPGTRAPP
ncbi:basic salivary proline-rich protein 2-like, partial [Homarus americanus]|uniref:basic salivary proline-rich protein 2-like n=1 Tax=Homarus americanus TaxID=6706 RepID=UPI001C4667ED